MRIVLIRHGKSDWMTGVDDFNRPLNQRGCRDAPMMAQELKKRKIIPDRMITSSALRALTTAQLMAKEFNFSNIESISDLYLADTEIILDTVLSEVKNKMTVFLFGHNPGISYAASQLTEEEIQMPTCSVVIINLEEKNKEWFCKDSVFIAPKDLLLKESQEIL